MIVSMAMTTFIASYYYGWAHQYTFKNTRERWWEFIMVEKIKNNGPSALWIIHESSQNRVTTRACRWKRIKIVFPSALWCFHILSQTPVRTPKLYKIVFSWNNSTAIKLFLTSNFLLSTLKMLLQSIFKFGPTAHFFSKMPKFETLISLFLRT